MSSTKGISSEHLFLLFWKASRAVHAYDQASIRASGFSSLTDFAVLEVLLHKGALPVNTIGEKVLLTSGSITTAIQRLEQKNLVRRERSTQDARVVLVELTSQGKAQIEAAFSSHSANLDTLFAELDPTEQTAFAALLRKVGKRAESLQNAHSGT